MRNISADEGEIYLYWMRECHMRQSNTHDLHEQVHGSSRLMRGKKKNHKPGFCEVCNGKVRRRYTDKLCGKCYLKKKQEERQKRSISERKFWF